MGLTNKTLNETDIDQLRRDGQVLETKHGQPAVVQTESDGTTMITKFWWPRRKLFSSSRTSHKCRQFVQAASRLRQLGFNSPSVRHHGGVEGFGVHWVAYPKIAGETLRQMVANGSAPDCAELARFLLRLHAQGVYFRALNMGNLVLAQGEFALIDVQDTRFFRRALTIRERARNLSQIITHPRDIGPMFDGYGQRLARAYASTWGGDEVRLRVLVHKQVHRRTRRRIRHRARVGAPPLPISSIPQDW